MAEIITATTNVREWAKALQEYGNEVTNKTLPEILNKRGLNIAARASQFTPRENKAGIQAAMRQIAPGHRGYGPWLFVLTNAKRKKKGLPSTGGMAISADATKFQNQRNKSVAYIASGWIPAIIKFGGHPKHPISPHSLIHKAQNKLAHSGDVIAILENTAKGAGDVGYAALEKAIDYDTNDMLQHVARLQKVADKHSAK